MALTLQLQDPSLGHMMNGNAGGFEAGQILYDAFEARFGNGLGAVFVLIIPAGAMLL